MSLENINAFLSKIGIAPEKFAVDNFDLEATYEGFQSDFASVALADRIQAEKRTAKTAAMKEAEKKILRELGLDSAKYKDLKEGHLDAMLADAKERLAEVKADKSATPAEKSEALEQLNQVKSLLHEANKQLSDRDARLAEMPTLIENAKKEGLRYAQKSIKKTEDYSKLKTVLADTVADDTYLDFFFQKHGIELDLDETGDPVVKVKSGESSVIAQKNGTTVYRSLQEYALDKKMFPENMLRITPSTPNKPIATQPNAPAANPNVIMSDKLAAYLNSPD